MIGNRLKQLREEKGMKQEELAKCLSVSPSAIGMYERNAREPNNALTLKICKLFNCSVDYLMGKSEYKNYDDYEKMDEYVLNYALHQNEEDASLIANTLNYINTHKDEHPNEIIKNAVKNLPLDRRSVLLGVISHLHYRYHSSLPPKREIKDLTLKDKSFNEKAYLVENYMNENKISHMFVIPILGKIAAGQPILADEYLEGYLPVDPNIYGMTIPDDYFYLKVFGESMNLKIHNGDYALIHKQDYAENGDIIVAIVNGDDEATLKRYKKLNEQFVLLEPMSTDPTIETITVDLQTTKFQIIGKAIGQFGKF